MKKFQGKTAQLTLGAILAAVFVILHFIIPGGQKTIQSLMMVLTFLPVTIYAMCCGIKKALVMAVASGVLCALLLPPEVLLSFAIPALVIGLAGGLCYGKQKRLTVILILAVLQMLQNIVELLVYYLLSDVNIVDTYQKVVGLVYERIPTQWLVNLMFSQFLEDLLLCSVPCVAIIGAGVKGVISFMLIMLVRSRLVTIMGSEVDTKFTAQTKFKGKGISIAYFCTVCVCTVAAALPFLGVVPYHFINAAAAALGILLALIYVYYFFSIRVRSQKDYQKRLIYSFLLVALLPVNIYALPWLEIRLLKKEEKPKS